MFVTRALRRGENLISSISGLGISSWVIANKESIRSSSLEPVIANKVTLSLVDFFKSFH